MSLKRPTKDEAIAKLREFHELLGTMNEFGDEVDYIQLGSSTSNLHVHVCTDVDQYEAAFGVILHALDTGDWQS